MFAATLPFKADGALSPARPNFQRTTGELRLAFTVRDSVTAPFEMYQEGALKVRLPRLRVGAPEAVIINTAGGLTGGDSVKIAARVGEGASAVISGQACEKIYKSSGGDACISTTLKLEHGAAFEWLVQPTILFDRGRLRRTMSVDMAADATLLAVEAVVFGRTAMDEAVTTGFVSDTWRIRRDGVLVYADTFRVADDIKTTLAAPAVLAGHRAMASLIYAAPEAEARRDEMREIIADMKDAAVSAWNGLMVTRLAAVDGYSLTRDLIAVLTRFRRAPMPRVWMI
jgi:urease accessory protein